MHRLGWSARQPALSGVWSPIAIDQIEPPVKVKVLIAAIIISNVRRKGPRLARPVPLAIFVRNAPLRLNVAALAVTSTEITNLRLVWPGGDGKIGTKISLPRSGPT